MSRLSLVGIITTAKTSRPVAFVAAGSIGVTLALSCTAGRDTDSTGRLSEVTPQEAALLAHAQHVMERDCMTGKGFRYWLTPENPVPDSREFPYAVDDVAWARKHGYGSDIARRIDEVRRSDPNNRYVESLTPQRRTAVTLALNGDFRRGTLEVKLPMGATMGRSDNGCTADAERTLYGDLKTWFEAKQITANLAELRRTRVFNDPRYLARTPMVLGCMRAHGHTYDGLDQARAGFLGPRASHDRTAEISTAVTEAKCATSTGFSAFADRLDREYGEEISRKYRSVYTTRFRLEHKALARARSALKDR